MDVKCEQCGTEYEFDETLVSDRGTTVKCTECGHLFKVFRAEGGNGAGQTWQLRRRDGSVVGLGSIRELQKRIAEGEFSERDEISRDGRSWKSLGRIAELETFFAMAKRASGRPRRNTPFGIGAVGPTSAASTSPPPGPLFHDDLPTAKTPRPDESPRFDSASADAPTVADVPIPEVPPTGRPAPRRQKTLYGVGLLSEAATTTEAPTAEATSLARPSAIAEADTLIDVTVDAPSTSPRSETDATAPLGLVRATPPGSSTPPRALYIDERDAIEAPRPRKSRMGLVVTSTLLLALAGTAALNWPVLAPMLGLAKRPDPAAEFLARGEARLAEAHPAAYEAAVREFTRATAIDERDPRVLRALSRAHALWAQALAFEASDLEARADGDSSELARAATRKAESARHAGDARTYAEDAVRREAQNYEGLVALADAMRLSGDETGAERQLERAEATRGTRSAEHHLVSALLAERAAGGDFAAARPGAEQAISVDDSYVPARLVLVRALLAQREIGRARQEVDAILARSPAHPAAVDLKRAIERGIPPAPPVMEVAEADPAPDAPPPPVAEAPPSAPPSAPATTSGTRSGGFASGPASSSSDAVPPGRDYGWYVRKGDEELDKGNLSGARAFFETALEQRPGASEALTGLGNVALRLGDAAGAVRRFEPATRAGYADAFVGLAEAHRRLGQDAEALRAYERYLDRLPNGRHASVARTQIELLRARLGNASERDAPRPAPSPDPPSTRDTEPAAAPAERVAPPSAPPETEE